MNSRYNPFLLIRSQSGSVLIIALVGVVLLGIMAAAAATIAQQGNEQARRESELKALLAFTQNLETVLSTNSACVGIPGVIDGLKFNNGAGFAGNQFNLAAAVAGQPVSLGTQLPIAGGRFVATAGASYTPSNIVIDQLMIRNAVLASGTTYNADIVLQAKVNNRGFAPREVGKVTLSFDGGNNLVSCDFTQSAATACEAMNCKFNSSAPNQKCVCGFPAMSCQTSPGQPQQYIAGINQSTSPPTPICSDFKVDCSDPAMGGKGPGYFLSGFDQNGDPMCQPVEGGVATLTPAPSVACYEQDLGGFAGPGPAPCDSMTYYFSDSTCSPTPVGFPKPACAGLNGPCLPIYTGDPQAASCGTPPATPTPTPTPTSGPVASPRICASGYAGGYCSGVLLTSYTKPANSSLSLQNWCEQTVTANGQCCRTTGSDFFGLYDNSPPTGSLVGIGCSDVAGPSDNTVPFRFYTGELGSPGTLTFFDNSNMTPPLPPGATTFVGDRQAVFGFPLAPVDGTVCSPVGGYAYVTFYQTGTPMKKGVLLCQ